MARTLKLRKRTERARKPNSGEHIDRTPDAHGKVPEASMSVDALMKRGAAEFDKFNRLSRRSTLAFFLAGFALSLAKAKVTDRTWGKVLARYNIPASTAWEAIELFERAKNEEEIRDLTVADALKKFGIRRPKEAAAAAATVNEPGLSDREADEPTDGDLDAEDEREIPRKSGRKTRPIEAGDDRDDDDDDDETDDDEEDLDPDEESAADDEEDDDVAGESDEAGEQAEAHSPLEAMDHALAWLGNVEDEIDETNLDDDSVEKLLVKIQDAEVRLARLREAVELQATED